MAQQKTIKLGDLLTAILKKYKDYEVYNFNIDILIGEGNKEKVKQLINFEIDLKTRKFKVFKKDFSKQN